MITNESKQRIIAAIADNRKAYPSDSRHAAALGISAAVYSQIRNGDTERKLSDAKWIAIARRLDVNLGNAAEWKIAATPTYQYIYAQLETCQAKGLSAMFCGLPNIGKTLTAKQYARQHANVVYVDASQVKSKQRLVRHLAKGLGIGSTGRYADVYDDMVYYLRSLQNPLIIIDEAGDLKYDAFLELKALWNATEYSCGWYLMGADAFRCKLDKGVEYNKVGFAEIRSRYGDKYNTTVPVDSKERETFLIEQALAVAKANAGPGDDYREIARRSGGSLRRVHSLITKVGE